MYNNSVIYSSQKNTTKILPPLYPRQKKVLNFIEKYIEENGRTPTLSEIRDYLGVKSLSTVHWHLIQLERKGYIKRDRESKGIDLVITVGRFAGAVINIPLIGYITAGYPIDAIEHGEEVIPVPEQLIGKRNPDQLFCLSVRGESMIDSYVLDGDMVICEKIAGPPNNGDLVVALLDDGTATLKKIYFKKKYESFNNNLKIKNFF